MVAELSIKSPLPGIDGMWERAVGVSTKERGVEAVQGGSQTWSSHVLWELYQHRHEENKGGHGSKSHLRSGRRRQRCAAAVQPVQGRPTKALKYRHYDCEMKSQMHTVFFFSYVGVALSWLFSLSNTHSKFPVADPPVVFHGKGCQVTKAVGE